MPEGCVLSTHSHIGSHGSGGNLLRPYQTVYRFGSLPYCLFSALQLLHILGCVVLEIGVQLGVGLNDGGVRDSSTSWGWSTTLASIES